MDLSLRKEVKKDKNSKDKKEDKLFIFSFSYFPNHPLSRDLRHPVVRHNEAVYARLCPQLPVAAAIILIVSSFSRQSYRFFKDESVLSFWCTSSYAAPIVSASSSSKAPVNARMPSINFEMLVLAVPIF